MPRILVTILVLAAIGSGLYFGSDWLKDYLLRKRGETCRERMWLIEQAKTKFQEAHPRAPLQMHADLLPFLAFTGFPMCPDGGKYENQLSLEYQTSCVHNGDPEFEPPTPGIDPLRNGYHDLTGGAAEAVPFNEWASSLFKQEEPEANARTSLFKDDEDNNRFPKRQ